MSSIRNLIFILIGYILVGRISSIHAQETGAAFGRPEPMVFDLVDPLGAKKNEF